MTEKIGVIEEHKMRLQVMKEGSETYNRLAQEARENGSVEIELRKR